MKYGIVITTINDPSVFLEGYRQNFEKYGHMDDVAVYIIPDKKTPPLYHIPRKWADNVVLPAVEMQEQYIRSLDGNPSFFPYNSDRRRNIGYLMALGDACDVVISLDDDNYCPTNVDFLFEHSRAAVDIGLVFTFGGWVNPCSILDNCMGVYARGFPYFARNNGESPYSVHQENVKIRVNAGLWEEQPDMDAMTWLHSPIYHARSNNSRQLVLSARTENNAWAPICSQNTAVHSDLIPAYYFQSRGRFGDIFQGYVLQAVMKHFGYSVRFGSPYVRHERNSHNYVKDMIHEHSFIVELETLLPKLTEVKLTGSTVAEAYLSLADWLKSQDISLVEMGLEMEQWIKMCKNIGVTV